MAMTDPIGDMLTRIRNASAVEYPSVTMPASGVKQDIARVLANEGYIKGFEVISENNKPELRIDLKYFNGEPVIESLRRISRPGRRTYCGLNELPEVNGGLGEAIISTSQGIMTAKQAKKVGIGGEVICTVT